jgi:ATP-dependent Lon protease
VLFITTANILDPIPPAFLDRMEVLRLAGYSEHEKLHIARRHLLPKQLMENGISSEQLSFTEAGLRKIIQGYTREAGLRNLEREIAAVCRKVAMRVARGRRVRIRATPKRVEAFLGPEKHFCEALLDKDRVGIATGLAWTAAGGDLLLIEVIAVPGEGKLLLTGQLGDVMKESAQAALSYVRSLAEELGQDPVYFSQHDLHIHAPAGSIPKDGPSAGITIATALASTLLGIKIDRRIAMSGEITLRGDILPVGGIKEKLLAAYAAGITTVILPRLNERHLAKLPPALKKAMTCHFPSHMTEALRLALPDWRSEDGRSEDGRTEDGRARDGQ